MSGTARLLDEFYEHQCHCMECEYWEAESKKGLTPMIIKPENVFATSKARNAAYASFNSDLALCESYVAIGAVKSEHLDLFSKLREEKQLGYDWNGYDYLEEMNNAIENQKSLISQNQDNENVYTR